MIYLKTDEEIELMREANQLVGKTLGEVAKHIAPGVSTLQLDKIAEEFIRDNGAVPAFLGYGGFPNSICASVNDQVVHGIPSSKMILNIWWCRYRYCFEVRWFKRWNGYCQAKLSRSGFRLRCCAAALFREAVTARCS